LIWDLFNFTSGLTTGGQIMDRHMMIIEKAFDLLGFHVDLSVKDQNIIVIDGISKITDRESGKTKYVGFNEKGINPEIFFADVDACFTQELLSLLLYHLFDD